MDFLDLSKRRESCRNFTGEPVSKDDLVKITEAGRLSPSACNSQPWSFYVSGGEKAAEIKKGVQVFGMNGFTSKASAFIVLVGEKPNYLERVGQAIGDRDFASIDIGIAVANMALCATTLGLGSCILGSFKESAIKNAIGLGADDKRKIRLVLAVGVPADRQPREKNRKSADKCVRFID